MRTIVFDIPAEYGGAVKILESYYYKAVGDKDNEWIFIISTPTLEETSNVKVIRYPWVKKSWFHRVFFDIFFEKRIVKRYSPDKILSLQNIAVKSKIKQVLYVHQAIPFCEKKFKFVDGIKIWTIQNLIGRLIYKSIKKADKVIVQTHWMKKACVEKTKVNPKKILVIQPKVEIDVKGEFRSNGEKNIFFYPANASLYKNHKVIIDALEKLDFKNYEIVFTITGQENKNVKLLYERCIREKLNVKFIGNLDKEEINNYYSKSILIFPSYIETFGLPLLEAKMYKCPILASDCNFSHEVLKDYSKKIFFNPFDCEELANSMKRIIKERSLL